MSRRAFAVVCSTRGARPLFCARPCVKAKLCARSTLPNEGRRQALTATVRSHINGIEIMLRNGLDQNSVHIVISDNYLSATVVSYQKKGSGSFFVPFSLRPQHPAAGRLRGVRDL